MEQGARQNVLELILSLATDVAYFRISVPAVGPATVGSGGKASGKLRGVLCLLTADDRTSELPVGYSERLHERLAAVIARE
jgi:hypothetical protein